MLALLSHFRKSLPLALAAAALACALAIAAPLAAQSSRVEGIVYDSLDHHPLDQATVQLIEAPPGRKSYAALTDSLGHFTIDSVRAGTYIAGFLHALLDTLGVSAPFDSVTIPAGATSTGATSTIVLGVPSERMLARAICGDAPTAKGTGAGKDSVGMIVGHVNDASTGAPLGASSVTLEWPTLVFGSGGPHTETRTLHAKTTNEGWFAMCGLAEDEYQLHAEHAARATGMVDVAIHSHDVARLTLLVGADPNAPGDSTARQSASIAGRVTTHDGHPLEGAQVVVDGSATSVTTDSRGAFALTGIPDGTRMAEVRALGYEPLRVRVEPSRTDARPVTIVMGKRVASLDQLTIFGKPSRRMRDLTGFAERSKKGFGRFITRKEIDDRNVLSACDLLRQVPGVSVFDDGTTGCSANIRGSITGTTAGGRQAPHLCEPTVYEDNIAFGGTFSEFSRTTLPKDIMGIEIYSSSTEPPQFFGACGVIVVWTKIGV